MVETLKKIVVSEGNSGILYVTETESGLTSRFTPNYDLDEARRLLYDFYELETTTGKKVKDSFVFDGIDWFPTTVSQLYWILFFQYVKYKKLLDSIEMYEITTRKAESNNFTNLLNLFRTPKLRTRVNGVIKNVMKLAINSLIDIRNTLLVSNSSFHILFLGYTIDDFRTSELLPELKTKYSVPELTHVQIRVMHRYLFDPSVWFLPYSSQSQCNNLPFRLKNQSSKIFEVAFEFAWGLIERNRVLYKKFKKELSGRVYKAVVGLDDTNFVYPIIFAAQDQGLKCVGIQHGCYVERHESYVLRHLKSHRWYDYLIVWGDYWREKFVKNNSVFPRDNIVAASNKHNYNHMVTDVPATGLCVLIPYEFLADTREVGKYMQKLNVVGIDLIFKARKDETLVGQLEAYDLDFDTLTSLTIVQDLTREVLSKVNVIAGTQTTLLYDLLPLGKVTWIFETTFRLQEDMVEDGLARLIKFSDLDNIKSIYLEDLSRFRPVSAEKYFGKCSIVDALQELIDD
jgi:hypothetical protein